MADAEIATELKAIGAQWDASRTDDDEGHGGSPGEWMVERMDELETEQKRRADLAQHAKTAKRAGKKGNGT